MSKKSFFSLPLWDRFSKKMVAKLETLRSIGYFDEKDVPNSMFLSIGRNRSNELAFFFLVDKEDGIIVDVKFQAIADTATLAIADIAAHFAVGKTYEQMGRTSLDLLIKQLEFSDEIPIELDEPLEAILEAFKKGADQCLHIPLAVHTPLSTEEKTLGEGYPDWQTFSKEKKLQIIEDVLNKEVRPYVALDEGGIEVLGITDNELKIAYQGNCTSCFSSVGSTLSAIQDILQEKIDKNLTVIPDLENLKLN